MTQARGLYPHRPSWLTEIKRWIFNCPNHKATVRRAQMALVKKAQVTREAEDLVLTIRRSHERQA